MKSKYDTKTLKNLEKDIDDLIKEYSNLQKSRELGIINMINTENFTDESKRQLDNLIQRTRDHSMIIKGINQVKDKFLKTK